MHSHISDAFVIIDEYLPFPYVDKVKKYVDSSSGSIRNVRYRREGNIKIIKALLEVSLNHKKEIESLTK